MAAPEVEAKAVEAKVAEAVAVQAMTVGEVSCNVPVARDEAERLRVQELLRYFQPQHDPQVGVIGKARVATDATLTAFAQLSALKLDCQRAFISLMTSSHQYIIAEATRTISIKSEDVHDGPDDAIYLGQSVLDFEWGVCPGTIACFTSTDGSLDVYEEWVKASRSYYVMNDMSMLEGYKTRPYIAGWPFMKYYAEVPIHSPSGLTIGTLCVVDDKPREGLDLKGLAILEEISHCVMDHLELCICRIQRNNAERMIQALGQFVEGKPSVRQWWMEAQASRGVEPGLQHLSIEKRAEIELGTSRGSLSIMGNVDDPQELLRPPKLTSEIETLDVLQKNTSPHLDSEGQTSRLESATSEVFLLPDASIEESIKGSSSATTAPSSNSAQVLTNSNDAVSGGGSVGPSQLEGMLARATNLIREGIGLDGVLFFDPRSSEGLLLTEQNPLSEQGSWTEKRQVIRRTSIPLYPVHTAPSAIHESQGLLEKYSKIMASSTRENPYPDPLAHQTMHLLESTLGNIMKLFPRGGILHYDKDGFIGGSNSVFTWANTTSQFIDSSIKNTSPEHSVAANHLRQILPGATSVLLFPLWDTNRDKWFAYSMAWTTNSNRVFQRQDFAYLASFGNSIMAELSRFETIAADQAKGTFISSISHELRSPLHGIMASLELLREINSDPISTDMINTVESCGSTLLETLENLLTFAKINRGSATADRNLAIAGTTQDHTSLPRVDLSALVEEITQMCMVGHHFRQTVEKSNTGAILDSPGAGRHPTVTVICDIAPRDEWVFDTGAEVWKRVLMNVLGNSLKYTSSGYIHVKLRREETLSAPSTIITDETQKSHPVKSSSSSTVILSVEDSGRGISQDYLTHHLFKPFYQEDPMNPGNGLGLSIVSQLVSSVNGFTSVTSELGVGTKVKVSVVLNQDLDGNDQASSSAPSNFRNLRLGVFGLDAVPDLDETPSGILTPEARCILAIRSTLESYAESLGISVSTLTTTAVAAVDIVLTTEAHCQSLRGSVGRPLIVLGGKPALHYSTNRQTDGENGRVVILSQPFGPRNFQKAIESCLSRVEAPSNFDQTRTTISQPVDETTAPRKVKDEPKIKVIPKIQEEPEIKEERSLDTLKKKQVHIRVEDVPDANDRKYPRVLLVEDNPVNLKLLAMFIKKLSLDFETATNGAEAVELYRAAHGEFGLVFMDIQMPVMNGMEASVAIRKYEKQSGLPSTVIVALTALTSIEAKRAAMDSGVDEFLSKPISMKKIKDVVKEVSTMAVERE